ncbi:MAG: class I SAM-dependent methyltransferase [Gemmatimonadetes bacterium]|nr:class I SAM-dependent methyltransferase [Gemmatimonadota bacterium]
MRCRHCDAALSLQFLDLGSAPPSNAYRSAAQLNAPEAWFPLRLLVCTDCWLVQTEDHAEREALFTEDYAYFSSVSRTWVAHAERYVQDMVGRFGLGAKSKVVEIAANDGYLLQFVKERGIPCYGIEPTRSTAEAARAKGIEIISEFLGASLGASLSGGGRAADLAVANNVLAHVPDINDFVGGVASLLKPTGVATFEFPHLLRMVEQAQFDTAYHEHYSYLSLGTVSRIFERNGLRVFDVAELPTHGGSLRVFAERSDGAPRPVSPSVPALLAAEMSAGMKTGAFYERFQAVAERVKDDLLSFLIDAKRQGKRVVAYGAAAKGNTLLNFAGVRPDLLSLVCDAAPSKQGKFLPGSHIQILGPEALAERRPDYVLILPWNLADEVKAQLKPIREWGGQFVIAVPSLTVT